MFMKYTISINQYAVMEAGFDLDLVDMAIFDMLTVYTNSTACRRMNEEASVYFNVPYEVVIKELPLAKITKPDSVYRRFQKLEQYGILHMHPDNRRLRQVWFCWGRNYDVLQFKTGSESGQSPKRSGQKVDMTGFESGVRPDFNPAHNYTNKYTNVECASDAHTHEENGFETVENEDQNPLPPVAAPPLPGATGPGEYIPKWTDRPQANTPEELRHALSVFYHHHPEEWRKTREGTPAATWGNEKIRDVVAAYCEWRLTQDGAMPNYRQHNARLHTWFRDEPYMTRRRGETAVVSAQKAYQPFNFS